MDIYAFMRKIRSFYDQTCGQEESIDGDNTRRTIHDYMPNATNKICLALGAVFITDGRRHTITVIHCKWKEIFKENYVKYFSNSGFILASLVTLTMYLAIFCKIRSMRSKVTAGNNGDKRQQTQVKMCRMMGTGI